MRLVLATVGVPPWTTTAPPLTRIVPAALRLTVTALLRESAITDSRPVLALKVAVTAMAASLLVCVCAGLVTAMRRSAPGGDRTGRTNRSHEEDTCAVSGVG